MSQITRETEVRPDGTTILRTITTEVVASAEPVEPLQAENVVEFVYDGLSRKVQNPQITRGRWNYRTGYNALLSGVELERDGVESNEFKHFSLSQIQAT